jgi:RPA family protein
MMGDFDPFPDTEDGDRVLESHPVLASEVNGTTTTVSLDDTDTTPTFAILPTGVAAGRVQFTDRVTTIEKSTTQDGVDMLKTRGSDLSSSFPVRCFDINNTDYSTLRDLTLPKYVHFIGAIWTHPDEDRDYSHLSVFDVKAVDKHHRENFLINTARTVIRRVNRLQTYRTDTYSDNKGDMACDSQIDGLSYAEKAYPPTEEKYIQAAKTVLKRMNTIDHR